MKEKPETNLIDLRKFDNNPINAIEIIKNIVSNPNVEKDPFYIVDLEDICNKHINWITQLPRVEPHYAVKCNTDPMLLKLLAFLGAGFDCASKNEIQKVLDLGVSPHRIIFANPCKQASYIKYAYKAGVDCMTFDNELELYKIKEHHPKAKCVLRIITNDENAVCRFSMKFGADMDTSFKLVGTAIDLGLDLVGVSFHVGSGQMSPSAFSESIGNARRLFDYARDKYGHKMYLLDLGGGYPGSSDSGDLFNHIAQEINRSLDEHFPANHDDNHHQRKDGSNYLCVDERKLRIIAEPGRYYACSAFTLCVSVIAKRVMQQSDLQQRQDRENLANVSNENAHHASLAMNHASLDSSKSIMYYINDGVYASFNCLFYDHAECFPILVADRASHATLYKSSIWGPTCDGLDVVVKQCYLPELNTDEFMIFKNMGAYTIAGAVPFNGIPLARSIYVASASWDTIKHAFADPVDDDMFTTTGAESVTVSCALAANLAYPSRAALSTLGDQPVLKMANGSAASAAAAAADTDCESVTSGDDMLMQGSSSIASSDIADVNQLNDQLINDDITLSCIDQPSSTVVDCAT